MAALALPYAARWSQAPPLEDVREQLARAAWRLVGERWEAEVFQPIVSHAVYNRAYYRVSCRALHGDPKGGPPAESLASGDRDTRISLAGASVVYA